MRSVGHPLGELAVLPLAGGPRFPKPSTAVSLWRRISAVRPSIRNAFPSGVARVLRALVQRYVMGPLVKQLRKSFVFLSIHALVTKPNNAIGNRSIRNRTICTTLIH